MSKSKNKYKVWCSRQQYNHVMRYPKLLSSDVQLYKINSKLKFYKSIKPDKLHSTQTLSVFQSYRKNYLFLNTIKESIQDVRKYDIVFNFQGKNYLFHTYKILGFIEDAWSALLLAKDKTFQKGTIGEYQKREKDYYLSEYRNYRKQFYKPNNPAKGINLLYAFLYKNHYFNKDFIKYFLSYFAIVGVDNFKQLQKNNLESKMLRNTLKVFQSGKVTKRDCAKSLLSTLYFYLVYKMYINKNHAFTIAQNLVYDVFDISFGYTGSELLKNMYVKEIIGSHIIYSFDTKKEHLTKQNRTYIKESITSTIIEKEKFPLQFIEPLLENPLHLYSLLTPSELLQKI